jgi:hypothetical protein
MIKKVLVRYCLLSVLKVRKKVRKGDFMGGK